MTLNCCWSTQHRKNYIMIFMIKRYFHYNGQVCFPFLYWNNMLISILSVPFLFLSGSMECDLSGPTGAKQCFGTFGEPLIFHLPINASKIMLKKNETTNILNTINMVVILHEEYKNRSAYFTNGTFKLDKAQRRDSGDYQLQIYASSGTLLYKINMHLEIQGRIFLKSKSCRNASLK